MYWLFTKQLNKFRSLTYIYYYQPNFLIFPELTLEERGMLLNIRKKKLELLHEISQLKDELTEVNTEIEAMDTEEG